MLFLNVSMSLVKELIYRCVRDDDGILRILLKVSINKTLHNKIFKRALLCSNITACSIYLNTVCELVRSQQVGAILLLLW